MDLISKHLVYGYNGRGIATIYTNDLLEVYEKTKLGWTQEVVNGVFWLRAPETWLVDITEPNKILRYGNPMINLAYFFFIRDRVNSNSLGDFISSVIYKRGLFYKGFSFAISTGGVLESDYRVIGSDSRVYRLKDELFSGFIHSKSSLKYIGMAGEMVTSKCPSFTKNVKFDSLSNELQSFYSGIKEIFNVINCSNVYSSVVIHDLIDLLPSYDKILFIPTGCFKYLSSFISESNYNKVCFFEWHANKNVKRITHYGCGNLTNKTVLIIDKCYSGKTLAHVGKEVIKQGGKPITLALFPKNRFVLSNADYFLMLNRIYHVDESDFSDCDWLVKEYCKVINGG